MKTWFGPVVPFNATARRHKVAQGKQCPAAELAPSLLASRRRPACGTSSGPLHLCAFALILFCLALSGAASCFGQAPDVPLYKQGRRESQYEGTILQASKELFAGTNVLKLAGVKEQLKRPSCALALPRPGTAKLSPREVYETARGSHVRVGWSYYCKTCDQWHVNLAGGYPIAEDGAVATCYHVVNPGRDIRDGCLIAADEAGAVFPVTEILAANRYSDACILRVSGGTFKPLPLNTNVYPGDTAYCYSDPLDHRGYFSDGIVNRFYQFPGRRPFSAPPSAAFAPTRINVGTDWAPGSSGSAVLDQCGNAIGHVSTIGVLSDEEVSDEGDTHQPGPTMIVFHEAVAARDVLKLVQPPK